MIEWRWGLDPLTERDATANNLADVLDFRRPSLKAKQFRVPAGPFGQPCPRPSTRAAITDEWELLRAKAAAFGWSV